MDEQKTGTPEPRDEEPKPVHRHRRYSPPEPYQPDELAQPHYEDKVPEHYRWHDCM